MVASTLAGTQLGTAVQSRNWSEAEQEARRRWEHHQHRKPWGEVRDFLKRGWGHVVY